MAPKQVTLKTLKTCLPQYSQYFFEKKIWIIYFACNRRCPN